MEAALINEKAADQQVIKSLSKEIERLQILLMSKIIKSEDGKYYRVNNFEVLSPDEVSLALAEAQAKVDELKAIAPAAAQPEQPAPVTPDQPEVQQAPPAPADVPATPAVDNSQPAVTLT